MMFAMLIRSWFLLLISPMGVLDPFPSPFPMETPLRGAGIAEPGGTDSVFIFTDCGGGGGGGGGAGGASHPGALTALDLEEPHSSSMNSRKISWSRSQPPQSRASSSVSPILDSA
jgi:hypothetical protein